MMRGVVDIKRRSRNISCFFTVCLVMFMCAASFVSTGEAYYYYIDLDTCSVSLKHVDLHRTSSSYVFEGKCKELGSDKKLSVSIVGSSDTAQDITYAYETFYIYGKFTDTVSNSWQCKADPWLTAGHCSKNSNVPMMNFLRNLSGPYSQKYASMVQSYIDANTPPPAPVLIAPVLKTGVYLKYLDPEGMYIEIGYKRDGLYRVFKYPEQAKNIELRWEYWEPSPDGKGGSYKVKDVVNHVTLINKDMSTLLIPAEKLKEGKWRLSVKHAIYNWPWKKQEFWIGPPVDYSKPMPVIASPSENAILKPVEEGGDSYKIEILVNYPYSSKKGYGASKAQPANIDVSNASTKIEVQYEKFSNGKWGPSPPVFLKTEPGKKLTIYDSEGRYRIRARWYVANPGSMNPAYPWTEWRDFRAGPIPISVKDKLGVKTVKLVNIGKLDTGNKKTLSGETEIGPGGGKQQAGSGRKDLEHAIHSLKIRCKGKLAAIVGTPGPDKINGTPGDDVIAGLGGNDTIYGRGGNDTICGGAGNDTIYGGPGDDMLFGGTGDRDRLFGGVGNDLLNGGPGHDDICDGGSGNNTIADCITTAHRRANVPAAPSIGSKQEGKGKPRVKLTTPVEPSKKSPSEQTIKPGLRLKTR